MGCGDEISAADMNSCCNRAPTDETDMNSNTNNSDGSPGCSPLGASVAAICQGTKRCQPLVKPSEPDCDGKGATGHGSSTASATIAIACQKDCCGTSCNTARSASTWGDQQSNNNTCCAPRSNKRHEEESCPSAPEDPDDPSCCKGKPKPCCDATCLDRIALRQCDKGESASQCSDALIPAASPPSASCCEGVKHGKPCDQHTRAARIKYGATLEALGCICRALIALGQESCCESPRWSPPTKKCCPKRSSQPSMPRGSIDSRSVSGVSTASSAADTRRGTSKDCCGPSPETKTGACSSQCCTESKISTGPQSFAYNKEKESDIIAECPAEPIGVGFMPDLEKGRAGNEHVILNISGMTCTGCETKLKRSLSPLNSIKNLKTSLVLSRAEFDLDVCAGSLAEVIKHLERTTEFKCERVANRGSNVEIIVPGNPLAFVKQRWPHGVSEMLAVDEKTVLVCFDPTAVGARELVERGWGRPVSLAPPRPDPTIEAGSKHVRHVGYMTLLSIVLTIPVLVLAWAPLPKKELTYGSASMVLATLVQFIIAGPFYPKALKSLIFSRMIEMDLLIVLSTTAAYIFSVVSFGYLAAGRPLSSGEFFETSTLLVTLIMVGRYVAALARQKAVESISLRSLQTSTAILVDEAGTNEKGIDARLLQYGDIFKVAPDSKVPTDGTVISGSSEVNESMVTGESRPVEKYPKSAVIAGSINGHGTLVVRLTRLPSDNTISLIADMVDEAKLSKPKLQDIADRVASYFVPVVVALTIVTFAIWIAIGVAVRKQSGAEATTQAITYAITILIVSCPCAIGLAIPMVVVIASGVAAERGVLFKSAESIEVACKTSHVVFDKTGTLTQGKLTIAIEKYTHKDQALASSLLLALAGSNKHPVSVAVATHLKTKGVSASPIAELSVMTGKGVEGTAPDLVLRAGNSHWLNLSSDPRVHSVLTQGYTAFCFTINGSLAAVFGLEDSLRPDTLPTVCRLQERGISVHILSGDDEAPVRSVATLLNVPNTNVRSHCTPADKQAYIQTLLSSPAPRHCTKKAKAPVVVFCGDGTNDAVALARATIGVHMNEGTDVAQSAADVVLMRPSLAGILDMITISEKSVTRIKFNFVWSFIYNIFAILLGAGAFVNARIPPEFAGLGELVSVVPVIVAAVLLRWA